MTHRYRRRTWADRNRPRVLGIAPELTHESGPLRDPSWAPERVAVMAHWSLDPVPSRSVVTLLRELDAGGFDTVLVSAAEVAGPLTRTCTWASGEPGMPAATTVLRRPNVGYDFGSWAAVLAAYPGVRTASRVLFVNDSLIGPFSSLGPVLAHFEACPTPVWGLSGSLQHRPHPQSFFVGYRDGVLDSEPMRQFWSDIRVEARKAKIVRYYELGLAEAIEGAGIDWRCLAEPTRDGPANPTRMAAWPLQQDDPPFLKANAAALGDPAVRAALAEWLPPHGAVPLGPAVDLRTRIGFAWSVEGPRSLLRLLRSAVPGHPRSAD